ncbi:MAG: hypothetical protein II877_10360 [Synergistaceae bacterium]|nr:hypothetical protein [Synergistaceae bacterium]
MMMTHSPTPPAITRTQSRTFQNAARMTQSATIPDSPSFPLSISAARHTAQSMTLRWTIFPA